MTTSDIKAKDSPTSRRTRARIIDAVVDVVALRGISGTTLANVAAAAGVSQGVLVFHFGGKEGLLDATLARLLEEYREAWTAALSATDPLERIVALVKTDFSEAICSRHKLALWFAFWGESAAKPVYNRLSSEAELLRFNAMRDACAGLVANPDALASSIDAHTDGLWLQMHIQGDQFPAPVALETSMAHLRLLLPSLAGRIG